MTALDDALAHPDIKRVFLAEVTAGEHLTFWTLDSGSTYYASTDHVVTSVLENGLALTSRASVLLVNANAGSYYFDRAAGRVYVHCTGSVSPYTLTLQAIVAFYFGNHPKTFNDVYYEPRLSSAPSLSLRIERRFTGVSQIGGGALSLENSDGYFDTLSTLQWDAGTTTLRFGADRPGVSTMAYADYEAVGVWRNKNWNKDDAKFSLELIEYKSAISNKVPIDTYTRTQYANLREKDIGKAIPIAYGHIKDATPVCIDLSLRKFMLAGHAITAFDAVRVKDPSTGVWYEKTFATTDTTLAQFTMDAADWSDGMDIAVDFRGKATGSIVMDNASDIVKDLITVELGEPASQIDSDSFDESYSRLDNGMIFNSSDRATVGKIGIYIDKVEEVRKVVELINIAVGSYLFSDTSGKYYFRVFQPEPSEGLLELTDEDIKSFSEVTDNSAVFSAVTVKYARRRTQEWAESVTFEIPERQYIHAANAPVLHETESVLCERDDANRMAQRIMEYEGRPQKTYRLTAPGRALLKKLPGDFIRLRYERHGINNVFEIQEISHDLMGDQSTLVLSDNHGIADRAGFLVGDSDTLPTRFANLDGYGSGSLAWNDAWDPEIKQWARENVGYWTDDNGFADTTDPDSFMASTWQ